MAVTSPLTLLSPLGAAGRGDLCGAAMPRKSTRTRAGTRVQRSDAGTYNCANVRPGFYSLLNRNIRPEITGLTFQD